MGDGAYATKRLAIDCIRNNVALVSRLKINAALFDFPEEKRPGQRGRRAKKGVKLKNFKQMLTLKNLPWKEITLVDYGGEKRFAKVLSSTCLWGADGTTPIPIRWAFIVDPIGKADPLPLMSTDPLMTPERMVELFISRWGLEVSFEETREQFQRRLKISLPEKILHRN